MGLVDGDNDGTGQCCEVSQDVLYYVIQSLWKGERRDGPLDQRVLTAPDDCNVIHDSGGKLGLTYHH